MRCRGRFEVCLGPLDGKLTELATKLGKPRGQVLRDAVTLYAKAVETGKLSLVMAILDGHVPVTATGGVNININIDQLIQNIADTVRQTVAGNIVKIRLTERERSELRDVAADVARWARVVSLQTPESAASQAALSIETLERWRKRILNAVKTVERRGLTLEDLANSQSPDAPLAKLALEALKLIEVALETAKADRSERMSKASLLIAKARELTKYERN